MASTVDGSQGRAQIWSARAQDAALMSYSAGMGERRVDGSGADEEEEEDFFFLAEDFCGEESGDGEAESRTDVWGFFFFLAGDASGDGESDAEREALDGFFFFFEGGCGGSEDAEPSASLPG